MGDGVRVGLDVTPMIGRQTGIGRLVAGLHNALIDEPAVTVVPFAMTSRGASQVAPNQRIPIPARPARQLWQRVDWPRIETVIGRLDVVHGTNYVVPPSRATRLVSVHDLTAIRFPQMCTPDVLRMARLLRRVLRSGVHVHADSHFVADEIQAEFDVEADRMHVICPGVPVDRVALEHAKTQPHPFGGRPYILALGTVEPRKDFPLLVRAFREVAAAVADVVLVIGGADGWGTGALMRELDALTPQLRARILRESGVSDARRDVLLAHCAVFAYPSIYEGFGFPPLEAMAAGRPVVATATGSLPEVLGDAAAFVRSGSTDELACALTSSLTSADPSRVDLGYRRVAQFRWTQMAEEFSRLYRSLATT